MVEEMDLCKMVCEGIKDEMEGQKFYFNLFKKLPKGSAGQAMANSAYNDESRHERYLRVINSIHSCECKV